MPVDADLVVDMRFLPPPALGPELAPLHSRTHRKEVSTYVLPQPERKEFSTAYTE